MSKSAIVRNSGTDVLRVQVRGHRPSSFGLKLLTTTHASKAVFEFEFDETEISDFQESMAQCCMDCKEIQLN